MKEKGARKVFAFVTHGIFSDGNYEKFKVFDKMIVSDSLSNFGGKNIEVVSMVGLFGEAIYRTVVGESLSSLFD